MMAPSVGPETETRSVQRQREMWRVALLVLVFGSCEYRANHHDHEIEINGKGDATTTIADVFEDAVRAYLDEDWHRCIAAFNDALHGYKVYKRTVTSCRRKCKAEAAGSPPSLAENIEDLQFYERKVKETLCLMTCNQDYREIAGARALKRLPRDIEQKFVDLTIYEYLHICYFQKQRHQDAANAAFTFLTQHRDHEMVEKSLRYYVDLADVRAEKIVNLEAAPFVEMYVRGVSAYEREHYADAVAEFESSLESYLESEEDCRIYCEGPFDQGWHPEFTSSLANHFAFCLKCKRKCSSALSTVNGNFRDDLLRSHYDYLQFAYYKLGNLRAACAAVASFLLFLPADETMLRNKDYYSAQPRVTEEYFKPRQEALSYMKRQVYELTLLRYISQEFAAIDARFEAFAEKTRINETDNKPKKKKKKKKKKKISHETNSQSSLHPPPGHSSTWMRFAGNLSALGWDVETNVQRNDHVRGKLRFEVRDDVRLTASEEKLGGPNRYTFDGFLDSIECDQLVRLARIAVEGDGYEGNKSPHSPHERFEGATVDRMALMVYFGLMRPELLELFLERTEAVRDHVERYFNLDRPLYFTYTHLVCRTALPDSPMNRTDLSHEIHADNCVIGNDNFCHRQDPAYTWRDYSAILYLNDDFDGGEFFFVENQNQERRVQSIVRPRCGRMVTFSAGGENLHGVQGVRSGKRCAVALWFTRDERYLEYERILAHTVLTRVRMLGVAQRRNNAIPLRHETLIQYFKKDETLRYVLSESAT